MRREKNEKRNHRNQNNSPRVRSQRIFTKNYNDDQVDRLKRLIQSQNQRGDERYYGIKVDGEFCVNKTCDTRHFDDYKEFIDGGTETIEVVLYFGRSNNCNRHIFYLKEKGGNAINGVSEPIDVDKKIEDALKKKDQEYLIQSLKQKVKDQEELIDELEEELAELKPKTELRGLIKDGLAMFQSINGGSSSNNGLSGAPAPDKEAEVTIEASEESSTNESNNNEKLFNQIYDRIGDDGLNRMVGIIQAIEDSKDFRDGVNKLIQEENRRKNSRDDPNEE